VKIAVGGTYPTCSSGKLFEEWFYQFSVLALTVWIFFRYTLWAGLVAK